MSFLKEQPKYSDADYSWNELEREIRQEVVEPEYNRPPGLSAVGNEENSNTNSYYSQSQEDGPSYPYFPPPFVNEIPDQKMPFSQSHQQMSDPYFGDQEPNNGNFDQFFGNTKNIKQPFPLQGPTFSCPFNQDKGQAGVDLDKKQLHQNFMKKQTQPEEDLIKKEISNENIKQEQEPEQEVQQTQPMLNNDQETPTNKEQESKIEWGKPLKPKKETKEDKKILQAEKSEEKESKNQKEDKKHLTKRSSLDEVKPNHEKS